MKTYLLVDTMNLMWRAAHVTRGTPYDRVGLAVHISFNSISSYASKYNVDHLVFCFEGRSWRKDHDSSYKANRKIAKAKLSNEDLEFNDYLVEIQTDIKDFLENKTNVTVLQNDVLEADDLIAGWIQTHPNDNHVILSTDGDFLQLLNQNVSIYNGVDKKLVKLDGIYDDFGNHMKDKHGNPLVPETPEYFLFEKIIRGDTSDNIKPAYPGVRKKGSKNKVGILECYEDRLSQGFAWNTFMNEKWEDHDGKEHMVKDKFKHNKLLIDLNNQPDEIKEIMAQTISSVYENLKYNKMVGIEFLKFCGKHQLVNLAKYPDKIARLLEKGL
jgi:5'-3' exonuclease